MFGLVTTLAILLTLPIGLYEGFLPVNQSDTLATITSNDPCVTEDAPSTGNNPGSNNNQLERNQVGNNDDTDFVYEADDSDVRAPGTNNRTVESPSAGVPDNLARQIQRRVQQGLRQNIETTPGQKSAENQFKLPKGFPFNNEKPAPKAKPTTAAQRSNTNKPGFNIPNKQKMNPLTSQKKSPADKQQNKTKKAFNAPKARQIQNNAKNRTRNGKTRALANPCPPSNNSGQKPVQQSAPQQGTLPRQDGALPRQGTSSQPKPDSNSAQKPPADNSAQKPAANNSGQKPPADNSGQKPPPQQSPNQQGTLPKESNPSQKPAQPTSSGSQKGSVEGKTLPTASKSNPTTPPKNTNPGQSTAATIPPKTSNFNSGAAINIETYNMLLDCFSVTKTATNCTAQQRRLSDLNKDGKVDQKDYNIFLYEIRIR